MSQLTNDMNCEVIFGAGICEFQEVSSGKMIGSAKMESGLYMLQEAPTSSSDSIKSQIMLWHYRLGHPSFGYLEKLFPELFANKRLDQFHCEVYQLAKHTRSVYPSVHYKSTTPFDVIHSDIWGPSRVSTQSGKRWFILFIDEHTRMTWAFLMKDKFETARIFQNFYEMVQTQFQTRIKVLKTDNARDYFNSILGSFLTYHGIIHSSSCVDTPEQNGIAERKKHIFLKLLERLCLPPMYQSIYGGRLS
ncbi:Retrovirus-related Pol polyprotein from transposon RE2 [Linum perenne]